MEEKSKSENPEKQAKTEVKDEALAEINGGGLGVGCDKNVASDDVADGTFTFSIPISRMP